MKKKHYLVPVLSCGFLFFLFGMFIIFQLHSDTFDSNMEQASGHTLSKPVTIDLHTLTGIIFLYTSFLAIDHDKDMQSLNSLTRLKIKIEPVPDNQIETKPALSDLIPPGLKAYIGYIDKRREEIKQKSLITYYLNKILGKGLVFSHQIDYPDNGLSIEFPVYYIKDSYYDLNFLLSDATDCYLTIELSYSPTETNTSKAAKQNTHKYDIAILGALHENQVRIMRTAGFINTQTRLDALIKAFNMYEPFDCYHCKTIAPVIFPKLKTAPKASKTTQNRDMPRTFVANSPAEVDAIFAVIAKAGHLQQKISRFGHNIYVKPKDWEPFGILATYIRYGNKIF